MLIVVEAFDWNCPQHIAPRLSASKLKEALSLIHANLRALEAKNATLRACPGTA